MKINNIALLLLGTVSFVNAEIIGGTDMLKNNPDEPLQQFDQRSGRMINVNTPNLVYPIDNKLKNKTPAIKQKEFQLSINPNVAREVRKKKEKYERIITNTNIDYLIDPERRALRDVDILSIHHQFITTITFPPQVQILGARSSTPMKLLQANQNVLIVQPDATFLNGNLFITYRSSSKNYTMNLLLKNYAPNKQDPLVISYQYIWNTDGKIDYVGILQKYIALNGASSLAKNFKHIGDYDTITIMSKTYYIIRDNSTGGNNYVDFKNMRFKIATRYEFENKSAKDRMNKKYKVHHINKSKPTNKKGK